MVILHSYVSLPKGTYGQENIRIANFQKDGAEPKSHIRLMEIKPHKPKIKIPECLR